MEYNLMNHSFLLQPNEVLETAEVRITNLSKLPIAITFELLREIDRVKLSGGPAIEQGLEFRLRT